jgi:hypothetical protein
LLQRAPRAQGQNSRTAATTTSSLWRCTAGTSCIIGFDRLAWPVGATISTHATGAPAFIQSDFDDHLEVLVPEGGDLVLYWLDGFTWRPGGLATLAGDGPVGMVQGPLRQ